MSLPRLPASDRQRVRDARWPKDWVGVTGRHTEYVRISDAGEERTFRFCPDCGTTVFWTTEGWLDSIAVSIAAFGDPSFPPPTVSVYGSRRYPWLSLPDGIEEEHDQYKRPFWRLESFNGDEIVQRQQLQQPLLRSDAAA